MAAYKIDVFDVNCGSRLVLDLIADQWTALVIHALGDDIKRYGELREMIQGVSQKMLTQTLRKLEREGIVQRKVYPVSPPKVEYLLTPLGKTLLEPLRVLCQWAEQHLDEVQRAREQYEHEMVL